MHGHEGVPVVAELIALPFAIAFDLDLRLGTDLNRHFFNFEIGCLNSV